MDRSTEWGDSKHSYPGKRCPQLTQFSLEGVILWEDRVGAPNISSSNKPVHVGVPVVHKATEMVCFKVTFWQKRNKNRLDGDVVTPAAAQTPCSVLLLRYVSHSLRPLRPLYQEPWLDKVGQEERSCNEQG